MKYAITWIFALAAIACGLLVYESDLLWKVQELNLFMNTSLFFQQQMVVPAGILTYMGTWFTQLFYYPWLGVTVLCGWWLLLLWLLKKTFNVSARWTALLLIPVALLLLTDVDQGYWILHVEVARPLLPDHYRNGVCGGAVVGLPLHARQILVAHHLVGVDRYRWLSTAGHLRFGSHLADGYLVVATDGPWARSHPYSDSHSSVDSRTAVLLSLCVPRDQFGQYLLCRITCILHYRGVPAVLYTLLFISTLHVSDGLPAIRHQPSAISHQESMVALGCTGRSVGHRGVGAWFISGTRMRTFTMK